MLDHVALAHRLHLTVAARHLCEQAAAAGADKACIKETIMGLGPAYAGLLEPEEVEGLIRQLGVVDA